MKTTYDQILELYTNTDPYRKWMCRPFRSGDKICATDAHSLVAIPAWYPNDFKDETERVFGVYPITHNQNISFDLIQFKEALAKMPLIDCYDEVLEDCEECNGTGEVEFEYDYHYKSYYLSGECPACEGEGKISTTSEIPNGKKELDPDKFIRMGMCYFKGIFIERLVKTAELLKAPAIKLLRMEQPNLACLFGIDEVEVLLMPINFKEELKDDVLAVIA